TVSLSNATNATIAPSGGSATGTILNDDSPPTVSIQGASQYEGDSGTTDFVFAVSLSNTSSQAVTVNWTTQDGSATAADLDYGPVTSGQVTFDPGDTSKSITVQVNGDLKFETDETFSVKLTDASGGSIGASGGTATGTILNDDYPPTITVQDAMDFEGN